MLAAGTKIGPYEILAPIGAGGMGEVYRARDTRLSRDVAIKVLPASFASDPERLRRFEQEARATGMLNHPNILAVFDVGTHQGSPYLVTELLEGQTLREELPTLRRKALDYARQITAGLAAAHAKGVTHRDLKPDNLFITNDGRVKILDFGLAKVTEFTESDVTQTGGTTPGIAMGTVGYMSPEQARGQAADHRSDIFSFGVVLYEMLSGQRAFHRDSAMDTLSAILKEDPPPLADAALEPVVRRCIEKSPEQRFQSAADLGFAIQALTGSVMTQAVPAADTGPKAGAMPKRTVFAAAALFAVIGAAAGICGEIWWQKRHAAPAWEGVELTGTGAVYGPRISPDGSTLAFITVEGGQGQVAVMHPGSANWTVLTRDEKHGEAAFISWSRDGSKIYFRRTDGVYSVPALGGDQRLFLELSIFVEPLADGTFLAGRVNADRRQQLYRYSPDTGRLDPLDVEILNSVRSFPDGRHIALFGRKLSDPQASYGLQIMDLVSGKLRNLAPKLGFYGTSLAIAPDGKSLLALGGAGDLHRIMEVPIDGGPEHTLVTLTSQVQFVDAAADGSIYADQWDRPMDVLRFSAKGGAPERIAEVSSGNWPPLALRDRRAVFVSSVAGRETLMVVTPGKNPVPLIETEDKTGGPLALLGDQVLFQIGKGSERKEWVVAAASTSDGRIVRRVESTRGHQRVMGIAGSPDGKTLYYESDGTIWTIPVDGGEARKLCAGEALAPNPNGQDLVVMRIEKDGPHLWRVPLQAGAKEQAIPYASPLLVNGSFSPAAIRADGRIAITVVRPDSWWDEPAILDPQTGQVEKLSVSYDGDIFSVGWTPDGGMIAAGQPMHGSLWRFRRKDN
jgi:hypothetical protein